MVSLSACGNSPKIIRVPVETTVYEKVQAPTELLEPCPLPELDSLDTNGDLERVAVEAIVALTFCNKDKERIKEWQSR